MPDKMKLHFKDGSTTEMDAIDARRVLRDHPTEWSASAFPADVQKAAQEDAEALRMHLAQLRHEGKNEMEVEKARTNWAGVPKSDAGSNDPADFTAPFAARDKGKGWWAIFDAANAQVGGNIRQPDAISFNDMSDEDKQEYVNAELAKA